MTIVTAVGNRLPDTQFQYFTRASISIASSPLASRSSSAMSCCMQVLISRFFLELKVNMPAERFMSRFRKAESAYFRRAIPPASQSLWGWACLSKDLKVLTETPLDSRLLFKA